MENKLTEQELINAAQTDENAFAELYLRYYKLVYYVANKICRNDADAQDVVQETFMEIKRSLGNLKNPKYFRLWVYRIVDSKCKKLFRKNRYTFTDIDQDHILNEFIEQNEQYLPEAQSKYQSDRELMHSFIRELPYDQKYAIIMYYMEQLTTLEISEILGIPEGTVKSRLSVARSNLRKKIEAYERKEGVKLNFQEGFAGAALIAAVLADQKSSNAVYKKKSKLHSLWDKFQSAGLAFKTLIVVQCFAVVLLGGMALSEYLAKGNQDAQTYTEEASSFPLLHYQGKTIQTSKEAYYTLKMNICRQDITQLSEQQRLEAMPLYQALKAENGVYYERLRQSGWASEFDLHMK